MAAPFPPWPVCQNYHPECEAAIKSQVDLELQASRVYTTMACYFDRGDAALKHFSQFFTQQSKKEVEHANYLMGLQNQHLGDPALWNIPETEEENWENGLRVMECALSLAKRVHQGLLNLHQLISQKHGRILHFLGYDILRQPVILIQELEQHITNLRMLEAPEDRMAESLSEKLNPGDSKN